VQAPTKYELGLRILAIDEDPPVGDLSMTLARHFDASHLHERLLFGALVPWLDRVMRWGNREAAISAASERFPWFSRTGAALIMLAAEVPVELCFPSGLRSPWPTV
jgi:hypothetical protein